jgi:hypothetical protein
MTNACIIDLTPKLVNMKGHWVRKPVQTACNQWVRWGLAQDGMGHR